MAVISVPKELIKVSDRALVESALPVGYHIRSGNKDSFLVCQDNRVLSVAIAKVSDGKVSFQYMGTTAGWQFEKALYAKFPSLDPDKVVWAVFYGWCRVWTMYKADEDKSMVLRGLSDFELDQAAILCSVRVGDLGKGTFKTLSSYKISLKGKVSSKDNGPVEISLTNLEIG